MLRLSKELSSMMGRLKENIKKKEGTALFSFLAFFHGALCRVKRAPVLLPKTAQKAYHRTRNYFILRRLLENKRVFIVGSGPSAADLKEIPDDVVVLTCSFGGKLFLDKKISHPVNLYLSPRGTTEDSEAVLSLVKTEAYIAKGCGLDYIRNNGKFGNPEAIMLMDDTKDNYYLRRLTGSAELPKTDGKNRPWASSGVRLVQYALYFKAKEVYLIGMDLNRGHFYSDGAKPEILRDGKPYYYAHEIMDHFFMNLISKKYRNIYSASNTSPITSYVPHKELAQP